MATMMSMGAEKMKEKGMSDDEMNKLKEDMEKLKNISADSMQKLMNKGMQALDSLNQMLEKK